MNRIRPRRVGITFTVIAVAAVLAGCGDDDDETAGAVGPYCRAALAVEAAAVSEDPAAIEAAQDALAAAAPAEITAAVDTAIARLRADDTDTPEFSAAYGELIDHVKANCGFGSLAATASEYAFSGLPDTVEAGPVVIDLVNTGEEFHELLMMRVDTGVTKTLDELLALPEEQVDAMLTEVATAFAAPSETGHGMVELQPGRYIVACAMPTGATPDNMAAIEAGRHDGVPHFTQGMIREFTVA